MKKIHLTALVCIAAILSGCRHDEQFCTITGFAQGGEYHVTFSDISSNGKTIRRSDIVALCDSILRDVENSVSGYNKNSVLSYFNECSDSAAVDTIMSELFDISLQIWNETDGLFDVAGAPLFDFWGFGFKDPEKMQALRKHSATPAAIDSILKFSGMRHLCKHTTDASSFIIKNDPRSRLNFNAIAQGFSCDLIAREFDKLGIPNYLIDVGMEIICKGKNRKGGKWRIGIDRPVDGNYVAGQDIQEVVEVTDCGIVTSGNYRKFFIDENGEKYAHSINPVTGYPQKDSLLSATVIAPNATLADAYATYCMVLGYEKAVKFLESRSDLHGYLITANTSTSIP